MSSNSTSPNSPASSSQDEKSGRPEIIVEFLFDEGLFFISVNNIGDKPALRVAVKFDKKIIGLDGTKEISALPLFRNIEFLGPGREIVTFLDTSGSYFTRKQPTRIQAKVSYSDLQAQKYETTITHDLEIYRDLICIKRVRSDEPPTDLEVRERCPHE